MTKGSRRAVKLAVAGVALAALSWLFLKTIRDTISEPYSVNATALSGWEVVAGEPGDPALVALQPPALLSADLFQQVFQRTMQSLSAPARPSLPLVLQSEYADSLQGVLGVDRIMRLAHDSGLASARLEPVCIGRRRESAPGRAAELFFAVFNAPEFDEFRQALMPAQPEHGGTGVYDPAALRPILTIAATDRNFVRWWPITVDEKTDCEAPLLARPR